VSSFLVTADFADSNAAGKAVRELTESGSPAEISSPPEETFDQATRRETRFMGRVVLWVILASIVGTAIGAAIGAVLAYTVGPEGTEGLIIQVVTWAIFAHLIIGMWAGYLLLADRTQEDLPAVSAPKTRVTVECATIDDANLTATIMREAGAALVTIAEPAIRE
jgi:hypothetical protein